MKAFLIYILILFNYIHAESFITNEEYSAQLYKNPRGIGCYKCHGKMGEGMDIAKYKHKGVDKVFRAPNIKNLKYKDFEKALKKRNKGMPRYFLTDPEIKALYSYVHPSIKEVK